jgi:hypothetical protein
VLDLEWDLEGYLALSVKHRNIRNVNAVGLLYRAVDILSLKSIDWSLIEDIIFRLQFHFVAEVAADLVFKRKIPLLYSYWTVRDEGSTSVEH